MNEYKTSRCFILDTVTYLQATFNPLGSAGQLINFIKENQVSIYISGETFNELKSTLYKNPLWEKRGSSQTKKIEQIELFLNEILKVAEKIDPVPNKFYYPRDPKDEKIINLAIETGSDIVTRDKDILSLQNPVSTEEKKEANRLKEIAPDLSILSPEEALHQLTQCTES